MKPLLINTFDTGGAAKSCIRLQEGLLNLGIDTNILLRYKTNNSLSNSHQYIIPHIEKQIGRKLTVKSKQLLQKLKLYTPESTEDAFLKTRSNQLELFSYPTLACDLTLSEWYKKADIINLHWVANFVDYPTFFAKNTKPVVWTLHDENAFSNGEHYREKYLGIDSNGEPIKRALTNEEKIKFNEVENIKLNSLKNISNLTIVSPSKWLADEAKKS